METLNLTAGRHWLWHREEGRFFRFRGASDNLFRAFDPDKKVQLYFKKDEIDPCILHPEDVQVFIQSGRLPEKVHCEQVGYMIKTSFCFNHKDPEKCANCNQPTHDLMTKVPAHVNPMVVVSNPLDELLNLLQHDKPLPDPQPDLALPLICSRCKKPKTVLWKGQCKSCYNKPYRDKWERKRRSEIPKNPLDRKGKGGGVSNVGICRGCKLEKHISHKLRLCRSCYNLRLYHVGKGCEKFCKKCIKRPVEKNGLCKVCLALFRNIPA